MKIYSILFLPIFLCLFGFSPRVLSEENLVNSEQVLLPALFKVFNEGDRHVAMRYYQDNINPESIGIYGINAHVSGFLDDQIVHGKLSIVKFLPNNGANERAEVIAENSQLPYILTVNRTRAAPYKLNYFYLANMKDKPNNIKITAGDLQAVLSGHVDELAKKEAFSGTVLIAKGDKVLFKKAVGQANKSFGVSNNLETKYALGSMNKMFTAIATLQLIEQGKLNFEDKLSDYVDSSWLPTGGAEEITIRQLLTHTSGLGNFFNEAYLNSNKGDFRDLASFKEIIVNTPVLFSPGTNNRYSSSGMHMLGLVIEKVSGQDYFDYIERYIYQKAKMSNSNSFELDGITPNLAVGYLKQPHSDTWINNNYYNTVRGGPAGGGYSTVDDLYSFSKFLTQFKFLSQKMTEQAYSNKVNYNSANWYGYGFSISGTDSNRVVGHGGASLGVDARLDIHLDTGFIVVILANQTGVVAPMRRIINKLLAQLPADLTL